MVEMTNPFDMRGKKTRKRRKKAIKVDQSDAFEFQRKKALREGRLYEWCHSQGYSEKTIKDAFCPTCEDSEICQQQRKAKEAKKEQENGE